MYFSSLESLFIYLYGDAEGKIAYKFQGCMSNIKLDTSVQTNIMKKWSLIFPLCNLMHKCRISFHLIIYNSSHIKLFHIANNLYLIKWKMGVA